jgi:competence protein ComEA
MTQGAVFSSPYLLICSSKPSLMNSVRKWIRDIFGFSGNEINGFLILIPLMLLLVLSEPLYHAWVANMQRHDVHDSMELDSLITQWDPQFSDHGPAGIVREVSLFSFDPNTAAVEDLRRLGLSSNSANHIAAYRRKGGTFRTKSDLLHISGVDSSLYKQLYDFIRLPARRIDLKKRFPVAGDRILYKKRAEPRGTKEVKKKFDINTADTLLLKSVYGIGSRLAARIIKFRDRLGGFVNPEQLYKVYGLDSMVVGRLLSAGDIHADFIPDKININTADASRLSVHPYIGFKLADLLVSYRFQHGDFKEVNDIKKLTIVPPDQLERLLPYIKVND